MSMLLNIPAEMRAFRQWIVWRMEWRKDDPQHLLKPTKIPYIPRIGGGMASVTNPNHWGSFEDVLSAPMTCTEPVDPDVPLSESGYSGAGFVFTDADPYTGIDLDDTHGDREAYERQFKIFREFNSYSELSPSGQGLHIIVKGGVPGPTGRRRASIEIYSRERYFTMTGNCQTPGVGINERQDLISLLYEQMGGAAATFSYGEDQAETKTDDEIIAMARAAANGDKFTALWDGDWSSLYQGDQSRADFALVDILAFYSENKAQITRLFLKSQLGQRDKATKRPAYVNYMVERSFDKQLPKVDIEGLKVQFEKMMADKAAVPPYVGAAVEPGGTPAAPSPSLPGPSAAPDPFPSHASAGPSRPAIFPPGLVGDVAEFILAVSPRPVPQIALAASIGLLSGITGRAYNVSGTGLNQYILMLAMTGVGKDAISVGTSKLMAAVKQSVPAAIDFQGPGEIASAPGLIKWLAKKPAVFSILGEFGVKLKEMAAPNANSHLLGIQRVLLQMYSKSGQGNTFDPMAYSDSDKNTGWLAAPSLTLVGESVPESFYEMLDEGMVSSGLLPRFMIFEYLGQREYLKKNTEFVQPPFQLVETLASLVAQCLTLAHNGNVHNVPMTDEAQAKFDDFDRWTTDEINSDRREVNAQLWNRAHLKAMKLAALIAVGINPHNPLITINETMYATTEVVNQTRRMLAKFEGGELGANMTTGEQRQRYEIYKAVGRYMTTDHVHNAKYGGSYEMHRDGVILDSHIQRRIIAMACFRNDKFGASNAIKRVLGYMIQADEIRELNAAQMLEKYGTKSKAYVVAQPDLFLSAAKPKDT